MVRALGSCLNARLPSPATKLDFEWREVRGTVQIDCRANDDPDELGCDPGAAGLPACNATVSFPHFGYRSMLGWVQLVCSSDNATNGAVFEIDPFVLFGDVPSPYCWYGLNPTLFDGPSRSEAEHSVHRVGPACRVDPRADGICDTTADDEREREHAELAPQHRDERERRPTDDDVEAGDDPGCVDAGSAHCALRIGRTETRPPIPPARRVVDSSKSQSPTDPSHQHHRPPHPQSSGPTTLRYSKGRSPWPFEACTFWPRRSDRGTRTPRRA